MPSWEAPEEITETDGPLRIGTRARFGELLRDHGDEVEGFSAYDPRPFEQYARSRRTDCRLSGLDC